MLGRRGFLCVAGAGVGLAALSRAPELGLCPAPGRSSSGAAGHSHAQLEQVVLRRSLFGTQVAITVLHAEAGRAQAAAIAALEELELVERLMSIYRPDSQLSRLNACGSLKQPHPYLVDILRQARRFSRLSAGAFDITVQPLWTLFSEASRAGQLPERAAIDVARRCVQWRRVEVELDQVSLLGSGTQITLNGIAQGYAADRAAAALRRHGIGHALIDTGEIGAVGQNESGKAWLSGIQHPRAPEAFISLARLASRCLATSGDYATPFTSDLRHHHLFDPATGFSPPELASVSVVAPTASQADALSTAVLVLGKRRGAALVAGTRGADALLVGKDGRVQMTAGFPLARGVVS